MALGLILFLDNCNRMLRRFLLFISLGRLLFVHSAKAQNAADTLQWSATYQLSFTDFKDTPDNNNKYYALSSVQINYDIILNEEFLSYKIFSYFFRKESWTRSNDTSLMAHEQLHFNIAEIFSRKLKKRLQSHDFSINNVNDAVLIQIYNEEIESLIVYQNLFDEQTRHGIDSEATKEWTDKIRKMLDSLDAYKEPTGMVPIIRE
jgi:hypothetical protein